MVVDTQTYIEKIYINGPLRIVLIKLNIEEKHKRNFLSSQPSLCFGSY
jgi:hypothetical protein